MHVYQKGKQPPQAAAQAAAARRSCPTQAAAARRSISAASPTAATRPVRYNPFPIIILSIYQALASYIAFKVHAPGHQPSNAEAVATAAALFIWLAG